MESLEGLFEKEFKNLYALEKQMMGDLDKIENVSQKKMIKYLNDYQDLSKKHYDKVKSMAQDMSINPGNTIDSVANEMLKNVNDINSEELKQNIKEAGLLASINRLTSYKSTCYENVLTMARTLKKKKVSKHIRKMQKKNDRLGSKFSKLAKTKIYKAALE